MIRIHNHDIVYRWFSKKQFPTVDTDNILPWIFKLSQKDKESNPPNLSVCLKCPFCEVAENCRQFVKHFWLNPENYWVVSLKVEDIRNIASNNLNVIYNPSNNNKSHSSIINKNDSLDDLSVLMRIQSELSEISIAEIY